MKRITILIVVILFSIQGFSQTWTPTIYGMYTDVHVGIGTSYPNSMLTVQGTSTVSPLLVRVGSTTKLKVQTNGGLSIGTDYSSTPTNGLYVLGEIWAKNNIRCKNSYGVYLDPNCNLNFGYENSSTGYLRIHNSTGAYNSFFDYEGSVYFRANGVSNTVLALQGDGTVTIGTAYKSNNTFFDTQGNKLMVNGGILCEEVTVINDVPTADYVFDPEYKLLSLAEVKEFIEKNKHLPGIKSAKEFEEEGYSVGEMDNLLLEKIEELTLYIIVLEQRISEMENAQEL